MLIALKKSWWIHRIIGATTMCLLTHTAWTQSFSTRPAPVVSPPAAQGSIHGRMQTTLPTSPHLPTHVLIKGPSP